MRSRSASSSRRCIRSRPCGSRRRSSDGAHGRDLRRRRCDPLSGVGALRNRRDSSCRRRPERGPLISRFEAGAPPRKGSQVAGFRRGQLRRRSPRRRRRRCLAGLRGIKRHDAMARHAMDHATGMFRRRDAPRTFRQRASHVRKSGLATFGDGRARKFSVA